MAGTAPGWYGKVASLGDFTARRLPPAFVAPWDAWLQEGMRASRARHGGAWLDLYRHAPLWRFVLGAGACGDAAVAGVLLPSIDRVGRHFPLTLAALVDDVAVPGELLACAGPWFDALARLGVAAMRGDLQLGGLDAALVALAPPAPAQPRGAEPRFALLPLDTGQAAATALARIVPSASLERRAVFWTDGTPTQAPTLLVSTDLPAPDRFEALLAANPPPA